MAISRRPVRPRRRASVQWIGLVEPDRSVHLRSKSPDCAKSSVHKRVLRPPLPTFPPFYVCQSFGGFPCTPDVVRRCHGSALARPSDPYTSGPHRSPVGQTVVTNACGAPLRSKWSILPPRASLGVGAAAKAVLATVDPTHRRSTSGEHGKPRKHVFRLWKILEEMAFELPAGVRPPACVPVLVRWNLAWLVRQPAIPTGPIAKGGGTAENGWPPQEIRALRCALQRGNFLTPPFWANLSAQTSCGCLPFSTTAAPIDSGPVVIAG
jgi:hypothetical protein